MTWQFILSEGKFLLRVTYFLTRPSGCLVEGKREAPITEEGNRPSIGQQDCRANLTQERSILRDPGRKSLLYLESQSFRK